MKVAVTGCNGNVGKRVVLLALRRGHTILGIDLLSTKHFDRSWLPADHDASFIYSSIDVRDYTAVYQTIKGCDAIVHLAGYPNPGDYGVTTHNANVVMSYNILRAAAELGINRVVQASSCNVVTMVYSQKPHFKYFPIDENHPREPDEPYGLSKLICELQADSIVRRYPSMRIASLRMHWLVPDRTKTHIIGPDKAAMDLWGYINQDSGANAILLAISESAKFEGHEAFFIAAPETAYDEDSKVLKDMFYPDVPVRQEWVLEGRKGFLDCGKAERILGWVHEDPFVE